MARRICDIAFDIARTWPKMNYAAKPYHTAMYNLVTINDQYFADDARSIVAYFLANATTWRGEDARRIKAELNLMLKGN